MQGTGIVAQQVGPLPTTLASMWAPVQVLAVPLPIQLPAIVPEKAAENGPSTWAPEHTWEIWKKLLAPGFGLIKPQPLLPFVV